MDGADGKYWKVLMIACCGMQSKDVAQQLQWPRNSHEGLQNASAFLSCVPIDECNRKENVETKSNVICAWWLSSSAVTEEGLHDLPKWLNYL